MNMVRGNNKRKAMDSPKEWMSFLFHNRPRFLLLSRLTIYYPRVSSCWSYRLEFGWGWYKMSWLNKEECSARSRLIKGLHLFATHGQVAGSLSHVRGVVRSRVPPFSSFDQGSSLIPKTHVISKIHQNISRIKSKFSKA